MEKKNAIDFLLFSYFGITLEDGDKDDAIIRAAIDRAYRDAFSRVFSLSNEDKKYNTRKKVSEKISKQIQEFLNNPSEYSEWHKEICSYIVTEYLKVENQDKQFTYGIAQKWINMTMKYLCVIKSVIAQFEPKVLIRLSDELENEMHVPIDGYILESIKRFEDALQTDIISWSKWTTTAGEWKSSKDEYHELQNKIKDTYKDKSNNLLDWEVCKWIEIAKEKREEEREKQAKKMDANKK